MRQQGASDAAAIDQSHTRLGCGEIVEEQPNHRARQTLSRA
jgi:hypothetical protein